MRYLLCLVVINLFFVSKAYAQSTYVLPYPSSMPGSSAYNFHVVFEKISKYWYFGAFGQFDYNLKMADKYLVQAKTLFEYKQYLLGYEALQKSDSYFLNILPNLLKAEKENKSTTQKRLILVKASEKHIETLKKMEKENPDTFFWEPEKSLPTMLNIKGAIENAIKVRKSNL